MKIGKILKKKVILFGANYSLIYALKFLQNNQSVDIVCTEEEKREFKKKLFIKYIININKKKKIKKINITKFKKIKFISEKKELSKSYSICFLGMPQHAYDNPNINYIMQILIQKKIPMVSIMNLPPFNFITKIKWFKKIKLKQFYKKNILDKIQGNYLTHSSTEPQIRKSRNVISVNHLGKLRVARFNHAINDKILELITSKFNKIKSKDDIPLSIKLYSSFFVPLSKLPMLVCGNYRCYDGKYFYTIKEAVLKNIIHSKVIYNEVCDLLNFAGAKRNELVPFGLYVKSLKTLNNLSSVAQNVVNKKKIERIDKIIGISLAQIKKKNKFIKKINKIYDNYEKNK